MISRVKMMIKRSLKKRIQNLPIKYQRKLAGALNRQALLSALEQRDSIDALNRKAFLSTEKQQELIDILNRVALSTSEQRELTDLRSRQLPADIMSVLAQLFAEQLKMNYSDVRAPFYDIFLECGFHLMSDHFYHPQPNAEEVSGDYWERISELPGVTIDDQAALVLAGETLQEYFAEFRELFPVWEEGDGRLPIINGSYMAVDGHMYYALTRHVKPKKIIEIGAGCSTLMAARACLRNAQEGYPVDYTLIEPYPNPDIAAGVPGVTRLLETKLQNVSMEAFTSLEAGDILFIDSSHVLRSGNDVHYEYLEILPRLKPGVYVHIHDISLPEEYPASYYQGQLFWTEQYLLQAFLAFNDRYSVIWPGNYLAVHHPEQMAVLFPELAEMRKKYPLSEPSAFWMRS